MAHGEHEPFLGAESPACGSSWECGTIPGMRDKLCFLRTGIFPKDVELTQGPGILPEDPASSCIHGGLLQDWSPLRTRSSSSGCGALPRDTEPS